MDVNGKLFSFDIRNVETMRRYEAAMTAYEKELETWDESTSQKMARMVSGIRGIINALLGEYAAETIISDENNVMAHVALCKKVLQEAMRQQAEMQRAMESMHGRASKQRNGRR